MSRTQSMPTWLVVILSLVAIAVLGPPLLGLLGVVLAIGLGAALVALKVAVVVLVIAAIVSLVKALFGGGSTTTAAPAVKDSGSIEDLAARLERDERRHREELDRQLDAAMRSAP
jgi:hypothetical protein